MAAVSEYQLPNMGSYSNDKFGQVPKESRKNFFCR